MISMDSWTLIMFNLMDGGQTWMAILYSHIIIVFGSFFLLNLILAVIMQAFMSIYTESVNSTDEEEEQDELEDEVEVDQEGQESPGGSPMSRMGTSSISSFK